MENNSETVRIAKLDFPKWKEKLPWLSGHTELKALLFLMPRRSEYGTLDFEEEFLKRAKANRRVLDTYKQAGLINFLPDTPAPSAPTARKKVPRGSQEAPQKRRIDMILFIDAMRIEDIALVPLPAAARAHWLSIEARRVPELADLPPPEEREILPGEMTRLCIRITSTPHHDWPSILKEWNRWHIDDQYKNVASLERAYRRACERARKDEDFHDAIKIERAGRLLAAMMRHRGCTEDEIVTAREKAKKDHWRRFIEPLRPGGSRIIG